MMAPPDAAATVAASAESKLQLARNENLARDERAAAQIRFRRAFTVAYAMWVSFTTIDWVVVRYLNGGEFHDYVVVRLVVLLAVAPVLLRLYRSPPPSFRMLTALDLVGYTAPAVGVAVMCADFGGLASPYMPGLCLVVLARTVTAQDHWRRGVALSGVPVVAFYSVLLGLAWLSPKVSAQLHQAAAITTFLLNSAYILGTYVFLVVGGHVVWSLRRQVFEARNLGGYRLKRRLASGGMGDVWVAYHPGLKRDVAVKILRVEASAQSEMAIGRFEREVRATAELMHPNTVRVFDYGVTEDGLWYYVMELLEGETLAAHVERLGPQPPARAVHILGQAARALAEAHERGIVHRDVKPENLFLTSLGGEHDFLKVLDFGIAKVEDVGATMTRTGWIMGTPAYMSPEVATGKGADPRADVYGLGAVLYFLLAGRPPFEAENAQAVVFAHVHDQAVPPSERLGKPLPHDLEAVVMRALSKDPEHRYANASELALALAACEVAGKWTFGDATVVARLSSRPPPAGGAEVLLGLRGHRTPALLQRLGGDLTPTAPLKKFSSGG